MKIFCKLFSNFPQPNRADRIFYPDIYFLLLDFIPTVFSLNISYSCLLFKYPDSALNVIEFSKLRKFLCRPCGWHQKRWSLKDIVPERRESRIEMGFADIVRGRRIWFKGIMWYVWNMLYNILQFVICGSFFSLKTCCNNV